MKKSIRRPGVLVASALLASAVMAGCDTGHATLGTSTSTCFLALPTAAAAVHSSGKLAGVKEFSAKNLIARLARRASQTVPGAGPFAPFGGVSSTAPSGLPSTLGGPTPQIPTGGTAGGTAGAPTIDSTAPSPGATPGSAPSSSTTLSPALAARLARTHRIAVEIENDLEVFDDKKVCVVEYQGTYGPGSVEHAVDPRASGRFALIVLPVQGGMPTVAFVVKKLPLVFRHFF